MGRPQPGQEPGRVQQVALPVPQVPVEPRQGVVLAVGVVVALLAAADLVAGVDHRHTGRGQQGPEQVAHRPAPDHLRGVVVDATLDPVVPGHIVLGPVPVALTVGPVVLAVVGRQVLRGEAVVGGDEVHRGDRPAVAGAEEVLRPGQSRREVMHPVARLGVVVAAEVGEPERPDRVPVAVVPLAEGRRELAGAPAVHADVPRLGDVLHPRQERVGPQRDEERVVGVVLVGAAPRQRDGEVEAEPVDVALLHPVTQ